MVIKSENEIFICSKMILHQQFIRNVSQQERPESAQQQVDRMFNTHLANTHSLDFPKQEDSKTENNLWKEEMPNSFIISCHRRDFSAISDPSAKRPWRHSLRQDDKAPVADAGYTDTGCSHTPGQREPLL